jgi:hypothetical protein
MVKAEKSRLLILPLILVVISMLATFAAVVLLYDAAVEERRQDLIVMAQSQAGLIKQVARHDRRCAMYIMDEEPVFDPLESSLQQVEV